MAYDEQLAERIRAHLGPLPGLTEKKMFGGLAFLVNGNMTIAASGQGGLLVRVNPASTNALIASGEAEVMVMRGKEMPGWLRVASDGLDDKELQYWIELSTAYAGTLAKK